VGGEVDMEVPPPTWNIEEKNQQDSLQGVNGELGNPPDSSSPEGRVKLLYLLQLVTACPVPLLGP
jgi:hypothetical protein